MRRTLALAGAVAVAVGFTGLAGSPAAADPAQPGDVVLNEVGVKLDPSSPNHDINDTYLELRNTIGSAVDVSGMELFGCDATSTFKIATIPVDAEIPAFGSYLIAPDDYTGGDPRDLAFLQDVELVQDAGGVEFVDGNTLMDDLKWNSPNLDCASFTAVPSTEIPDGANSLNRGTSGWSNGFLNSPTPESSSA